VRAIIRWIGPALIAVASINATQSPAAEQAFTLTSPTLKDNGELARRNAGKDPSNPNCLGENISPALEWSNPPAGTHSYALILFDPEGRAGLGVVHFIAYGIAATVKGFAEGELSTPSPKYIGGKSTRNLGTYFGPCPPAGGWHHYTFTLIATDLEPTALQPGLTRDELFTALNGHAKGAAGLIGRFRHPD